MNPIDFVASVWSFMLNTVISTPLGNTSPFEIAGFITGIWTVWLTVKANIWNWPIGNANSFFLLIVFLQAGLYSDSSLQLIFIVLGFYGWWFWLRGGPKGGEAPIRHAGRLELSLVAVATVAGTIVWTNVLIHFTNSTVPLWDASTTVLSLAATWLLTRKLVENWPVWVFGVDLPMIGLYLYKGLHLTALLYVVFALLATRGWIEWRRRIADADPSDEDAPGDLVSSLPTTPVLAPEPMAIKP
jgi:nicotinamide mononucleotide transporter